MENHLQTIIHYLSRSHVEMAKLLEEQRHVSVHMSQLINLIPDRPPFQSLEGICRNSVALAENITSYLNSVADLEEAIAENIEHVIKELNPSASTGSMADEE